MLAQVCKTLSGMDNADFDRLIGLPFVLLMLFLIFTVGPGRASGKRWLVLAAVGLSSLCAGCAPEPWSDQAIRDNSPWRSEVENRMERERSERLGDAAVLGVIAMVVAGCGVVGVRIGVDDGEPVLVGFLGLLVGFVLVVFFLLGAHY